MTDRSRKPPRQGILAEHGRMRRTMPIPSSRASSTHQHFSNMECRRRNEARRNASGLREDMRKVRLAGENVQLRGIPVSGGDRQRRSGRVFLAIRRTGATGA